MNSVYAVVLVTCSSWNILRQPPTVLELSRQRRRSENSQAASAARARNQYNASLSATVSLDEMLGNPLEISNDLIVHQRPSGESGVDIYHAATAYAQLHRVCESSGVVFSFLVRSYSSIVVQSESEKGRRERGREGGRRWEKGKQRGGGEREEGGWDKKREREGEDENWI